MALFKAEGLLLRTYNLREADKILVLYTREQGKLSGVARGSRRAKSRLLAITQLFSHSRFLIYKGRSNLHTISQGELISSFRPLREDLTRMAYASYLAELLDTFVGEGEPNHTLFRTALEGFTLISASDDLDLSLRWFELMLMDQLGYRPELHHCVACGMALANRAAFRAELGGTLCHKCLAHHPGAIIVPVGVVAQMRRLLQTPAARLNILKPSERDRHMVEHILRLHIDHHLDRPLKSRAFLDSMKQLESGEVGN